MTQLQRFIALLSGGEHQCQDHHDITLPASSFSDRVRKDFLIGLQECCPTSSTCLDLFDPVNQLLNLRNLDAQIVCCVEEGRKQNSSEDAVKAFPLLINRLVYPLAHMANSIVTATWQSEHYFCWCELEDGNFDRARQLYDSGDAVDLLACALLITSWLERGLCFVYRAIANAPPPPLFRDLIGTIS
jgi:hypothetical protein